MLGKNQPGFIHLRCINLVVAANAGGAFSPFGDITTLIVWQSSNVSFGKFILLFIPSLVNFLVSALIMSRFISTEVPTPNAEDVEMKRSACGIFLLFVFTIATAVTGHALLDIPPATGMMVGLGCLNIFGYYLTRSLPGPLERKRKIWHNNPGKPEKLRHIHPFNVFSRITHAGWDTLLFFTEW